MFEPLGLLLGVVTIWEVEVLGEPGEDPIEEIALVGLFLNGVFLSRIGYQCAWLIEEFKGVVELNALGYTDALVLFSMNDEERCLHGLHVANR